MAKIPFYDDRLTPQGGLNVQARFAEQTTAADQALQNFGNAGSSAGAILMKIDNDNAIANTAKPLSEMPGWGQKTLQDLATNSTDGGYVTQEDGSRVTLTDAFRKSWDDQANKLLAGISNPAAKEYAANHLRSTYQSLNSASIKTEYGLLQANKSNSFDIATAAYARDAAGNDQLLDQRLADMEGLAKSLGFDEQTRNTKILAARRSIVESAMQGAIQRNAPLVADAIKEHYGVGTGAAPGEAANVQRNADGTVVLTNVDKSLPAGMRNNNPGNLIYAKQSDSLGPSVNRDNNGANAQAVYATPEQGMNAMYRLALKKFEGGKTTVSALISDQGGWTPGNTKAAANIAAGMGVKPGDEINLRDPATLKAFGRALITQEQGPDGKKYSDQMVNGAADDALAGRAPSGATVAPATSRAAVPDYLKSMVSKLEPDRVHTFLNEATSQTNKQEMVYRSQVVSTEQNHVAAWTNGEQVAQPMTKQDYVNAYGPVEGAQRFEQYAQIGAMGSDIAAMKTAPLAQQDEIVAKYKPDPDKPGYALAEKRYETIKASKDKLNIERSKDPIAWAQTNGVTDPQSIQWAQIETPEGAAGIAKTLQARVGVATTMRDRFGTAPAILNKDEAGKLAAGFNKMGADQKAQFLDLMVKSISDPDALSMVIGQIVPDSPVTGVAAKIYSLSNDFTIKHMISADERFNPQVVAKTILKGEAILNPTKADKEQNGKTQNMLMPEASKMQPLFASTVQEIFMGQPDAAQVAMQAARAYYAAKSSEAGDYSGEFGSAQTKRWQEAIDVVLGGVSSINGKNVRRPWGMDESAFKDQLNSAFIKAIPEYGLGGHATNFREFNFIARPDDSYIVYNGLGKLKAPDGRDVIIRLDGSVPAGTTPQVAPTATPNASTTSKALKTK